MSELKDERAWLIEETWSGYVHYIHRDFRCDKLAAEWRQNAFRRSYGGTPRHLERFITKNLDEAMRFPTREAAELWFALQPRWLTRGDQYQIREHEWPPVAPPPPRTRPPMTSELCEDCPSLWYPTDKTRCDTCPRRAPKTEVPKGETMSGELKSIEAIIRWTATRAIGSPKMPVEEVIAFATEQARQALQVPARGEVEAESMAQRFHEAYERLAPSFGYETRRESAKPWAEVPDSNRRLMTAVCEEILGLSVAESDGTTPLRVAASKSDTAEGH